MPADHAHYFYLLCYAALLTYKLCLNYFSVLLNFTYDTRLWSMLILQFISSATTLTLVQIEKMNG